MRKLGLITEASRRDVRAIAVKTAAKTATSQRSRSAQMPAGTASRKTDDQKEMLMSRVHSNWVIAFLAALTAMLATALMPPSAALAATSGTCYFGGGTCYPKMSTTWKPWKSPWSMGQQNWAIQAGTPVDMRCWTTGATQLNTAKWFYVRSQRYPYTDGYVPANAVTSQISVGHC